MLRTYPQIDVLINPFVTAFLNDAMEQLEGQIASAKISLAKLGSPQLYYVLTGNDFTLDINNPNAPKIVYMGKQSAKVSNIRCCHFIICYSPHKNDEPKEFAQEQFDL